MDRLAESVADVFSSLTTDFIISDATGGLVSFHHCRRQGIRDLRTKDYDRDKQYDQDVLATFHPSQSSIALCCTPLPSSTRRRCHGLRCHSIAVSACGTD